MTTERQVFDLAMGLMDEVNENNADTGGSDTKEYMVRTPFILHTLRGELYPISDTYARATDGKRPICPPLTIYNEATGILDVDACMSVEIGLDDFICQTIMPYGLAAHLLLTEDSAAAAFFQERYEELLRKFQDSIPGEFETIANAYGGNGWGMFNEYWWHSQW